MGRRGKGRGRPPVKGFRPGKEPPELRKRRAKAQLGSDASWAQKQMVETVGDRSPQEVQVMLKRWTTVLLVAAVVLAIVGALLYGWSIYAGIAVHLLTLVVLFLWFRIRKQGANLIAMAESIGGGRRKK